MTQLLEDDLESRAEPNCPPRPDGLRCYEPEVGGVSYTTGGCDPNWGPCTVTAMVPAIFPGNKQNPYPTTPQVFVKQGGMTVAMCGYSGAEYRWDAGTLTLSRAGFECDEEVPAELWTFDVEFVMCDQGGSCRKKATMTVPLAGPVVKRELCEPREPEPPCDDCWCKVGGGGGDGPPTRAKGSGGGGGAGMGLGGGGAQGSGGTPGVSMRYAAGGPGTTWMPGAVGWRQVLGRGWVHEFAERMVPSPDEGQVWFITRAGKFVRFWDLDPVRGLYQSVAPSDEYRKLEYVAGWGWKLHWLDGTVQEFSLDGLWQRTVERGGSVWQATGYVGDRIQGVSFPDGRSEVFTYDVNGRLSRIEIRGVGGSPVETWQLVWAGDFLVRMHLPDGRVGRFYYQSPFGHLTAQVLIGSGGNPPVRVERRWEYDAWGNAIRSWAGAWDWSDPGAVDKWSIAWDDPMNPTQATVTDPLGGTSVYQLGRDTVSRRVKVLSVVGSCSSCGGSPEAVYEYGDPAHPLRVTAEADGRGVRTEYEWDSRGRLVLKREAAGTALERETVWEYHPQFPGLPVRKRVASAVSGCAIERETEWVYDAQGNVVSETERGCEEVNGGVQSFQLTTVYSGYNSAGKVGTMDPPGFGALDQRSYTYTGNGHWVASETDGLGTTSYEYDGLGRRIRVVDRNGVKTDTQYDVLGRVVRVIVRAPGSTAAPGDPAGANDRETRYAYNALGDLACVKTPGGMATAYVYDGAGRVVEVVRGRGVANPSGSLCLETNQLREREVYTLDGAGHRVSEKYQRTTSSTFPNLNTVFSRWVRRGYGTLCHLDWEEEVLEADGGGNPTRVARTEYGYGCKGQLREVWDANHPRPEPAVTRYTYDLLDRLIRVEQPWGGGGAGVVGTEYEYDVQDHLVKVTDGEGTVTRYRYSDRDLLTREESEVSGVVRYRYNEHGEEVWRQDARGVEAFRTVDAFDRVLQVDYPGTELDTTYTWGTEAAGCEVGRLTGLSRGGVTVSYDHDCFGRVVQAGELQYTYDKDGNPLTVTYPGGFQVEYTYRLGRPTSLRYRETAGGALLTLVATSPEAEYLPFGPLTRLRLSMTTSRDLVREFDFGYRPRSIRLQATSGNPPAKQFEWSYTTDLVGNITQISQPVPAGPTRVFGYQDWQYFLTSAQLGSGNVHYDGRWTYDRVGNRMEEEKGTHSVFYGYLRNATGRGNTSKLLGRGPELPPTEWQYSWDAAGHLDLGRKDGPGGDDWKVDFSFDSAGQLGEVSNASNNERVRVVYDGRGFLRQVEDQTSHVWLQATYSDDGTLYSLLRTPPGQPQERIHVLYFAGLPVAIWRKVGTGASTMTRLIPDHLGTPVASILPNGSGVDWIGGFTPWGEDWQRGTSQDSLAKGIFLRLPGQWKDPSWSTATYPFDLHYNLHRWYDPAKGRYVSVGPLRLKALRNRTA